MDFNLFFEGIDFVQQDVSLERQISRAEIFHAMYKQ